MTKLCIVCPPKFLEWSTITDAEFYQASWVLGEEFIQLRSVTAKLVIVDVQHVSADGTSWTTTTMRTDDLAKAVELVSATEVIIPDVIECSYATVSSAWRFFKYIPPNLQSCSKMFIPQGRSVPDWLDCLRTGVDEFGNLFNTVGIPKVLEKYCSRAHLIDYIPTKYDIHLLGTWKGCADFFRSHRVRSWDTSLPFAAAQLQTDLSQYNFKPDLLMRDNPPNIPILIENVRYIQSLIG